MKNPLDIDPETISPSYRAFARLPRLTSPAPKPEKENRKQVAIIPIFFDLKASLEDLPALVQSAIYSRAACLKNTDAVAAGIPVKLYIEEMIVNRFAVQLMRNGVDPDEDVLTFDSTIHSQWSLLGKKTYCYYDPQLADYETVIGWDADTFFIEHPQNTNLFERLNRLPKDIFYSKTTTEFPDWKASWDRHIKDTGKSADEMLKAIDVCEDGLSEHPRPIGNMWMIHPAALHTQYPDMLAWIKAHGHGIGCDEVTLYLATHKFKHPVRSLQSTFNIQLQSFTAYMRHPRPRTHRVHMFILSQHEADAVAFLKGLLT